MYVVDASVWVGYFVPNDTFHLTSEEWVDQQVEQLEVISSPAILLAEVGGAVARRTGDSQLGTQAITLMHRLPNLHLMPVDLDLARFGADLAANIRLRGADALYVALAQRLSVPLFTWDREQLERGGAAANVFTPDAAPQ